MSSLEHLIRYESAGSGLAFRPSLAAPDGDAGLVGDCLALANAELQGRRRYLIFGVDDVVGGERRLLGVDESELAKFKRRFGVLIADCVEPKLSVSVKGIEIDGKLIGFVRLEDCSQPPYLSKRAIGNALRAGVGLIRRGPKNYPLQRSDLQRMFSAGQGAASTGAAVRVGFAGKEPMERLTLPALPINKLPSELAADRLRAMLAAHAEARDVFGHTETQFSRLMHAKLFGMDLPYEKHSDQSLVTALDNVDTAYLAADEHYQYEVRAHKINLIVANDGAGNLHDARVRLTIPHLPGSGVADRVYTESEDEVPPDGYPSVCANRRTIRVDAELGTLYAQRSARAFREPLRFWVRETMAGKAVAVDYEIRAKELTAPLRGTLVIYVENAALKSV